MQLGNLMERLQIVAAQMPVDGKTADNPGDYVSMKDCKEIIWIGLFSIGTAGDDPVIDANQASDAAGTGVKALDFTDIWHKVGATAISAIGQFTKVVQAADNAYDSVGIDGAENEMMLCLRLTADSLDLAGGFGHVRVDVADVGTNAQLIAGIYLAEPSNLGGTIQSIIA